MLPNVSMIHLPHISPKQTVAILGVGELAVEAAVTPGHGLIVVVALIHRCLAPAEVPHVEVAEDLLPARPHQDPLPLLCLIVIKIHGSLELLTDIMLRRRTRPGALAVTAKISCMRTNII